MSKVNIALIGHGFLGKWHLEKALSSSYVNRVIIIESDFKTREKISETYTKIDVFELLDECLNLFDAALVVTPTSTHFEISKKLLLHGKHVFCEKPLAMNSLEAKELTTLAKKNKRILQVGHSERCHDIFKKLLSSELRAYFSNPTQVTFKRIAPFKGRALDVGVVEDLSIHDIDLLSYLFDERPSSYQSFGKKWMTDNWDHVEASGKLKAGGEVCFIASRYAVKEEREIEIIHDLGIMNIDLMNFEVSWTCKDQQELGVQKKNYLKKDHLAIEQEYFYQSILTGKDIFVDGAAGANAVLQVELIHHSLEDSSYAKKNK